MLEASQVKVTASAQELVDHSVVKVETRFVRLADTGRLNARPGDAESIRLKADLLHQPDVFRIPMVVVGRYVTRVPVPNLVGFATIHVPHALPAAVNIYGAFDLVGSSRGTPNEVLRKLSHRFGTTLANWNQSGNGSRCRDVDGRQMEAP